VVYAVKNEAINVQFPAAGALPEGGNGLLRTLAS